MAVLVVVKPVDEPAGPRLVVVEEFDRVVRGEPMDIDVSVCVLAKNEEGQIERALRSVAGFAREVLVGDVASSDATAEVARGLGAIVYPIEWQQSFAAGRNALLARATGDWVVWLNPDEEWIEPAGGPGATLAGAEAFGFIVGIRNVFRPDHWDQYSETLDVRVFRNRPEARFVSRANPKLDADTLARAGLAVAPSDFVIRCHAYTSQVTPAKLRWSADLWERILAERPGDFEATLELGQTLAMLGDPRGEKLLVQASARVLGAREQATSPSPAAEIAIEHMIRGKLFEPQSSLIRELALRWYPNSPGLLWTVAESLFKANQWKASAILLERLLEFGRTGAYDRARRFDPRILSIWPLRNLAECRFALGEIDAAAAIYRGLLADPEAAAQAIEKLARIDDVLQPPQA